MIREVEMGPFKHTVDDGLDIRKAAFECMYTLLDSCLDRIDIFEFLNHIEGGLKDHYDIKMLTYLMVSRLAQISPGAVLQSKHNFFFIQRVVPPNCFLVVFRIEWTCGAYSCNLHHEGKGQFCQTRVREARRTQAVRHAGHIRAVIDTRSG